MSLPMVTTVAGLRQQVAAWRAEGLRVALVPTMGALHRGHLSLIEEGLARADRVVISVFVNPSQFGPREDFAAYPRLLEADRAKAEAAGAHLLYAPSVEQIYPPGFATWVTVDGVSEGLCGALRPGHFRGVATVVAKLLTQTAPDVAIFGEKDYQQLMVIRRMTADLDLPVEIVGAPVVREADGLAMSSRNAYLSPEQRAQSATLHAVMTRASQAIRAGGPVAGALAEAIAALQTAGFGPVDYVELRAAETLVPVTVLDGPARLLAAAYLGTTRLIDNIAV